jgi:hypothetical protein
VDVIKTRRLNRFQGLNRQFILNPLTRTRLIWWGRIWIINLLHTFGRIIEGFIKAIAKIVLIIIASVLLQS